jgi:hypothetical protein
LWYDYCLALEGLYRIRFMINIHLTNGYDVAVAAIIIGGFILGICLFLYYITRR